MMRSGWTRFGLLSSALCAGSIQAATHCVPLSHPGPCDQWHATIQEAVNAAATGDEVRVAAGSYSEPVVIDRSLTLRGAQAGVDARDRSSPESILTHPLGPLTIAGCGHQVVVDGFTLAGATSLDGTWAGLWVSAGGCGPAPDVRLTNTIVRDNIVGVWLNGGIVHVHRNRIVDNDDFLAASEGIHSDAPTQYLEVENNDFSGHASASIAVVSSAIVSITTNRLDERILLAHAPQARIERNVCLGGTLTGSLIELAGDDFGVSILGNVLRADAGRAILVSDGAGTGVANSGLVIRDNCISNPAAIGLEVLSGAYSGALDAASNWWGATSGPSGIGPGTGAAIAAESGMVQFNPFDTSSATCGCVIQADGAPCDDASACTSSDTCSGGLCAGTPVNCGDANPCTDDSCDSASGCLHVNNLATCDDGLGCTSSDRCNSGVCSGTGVSCDDHNPCTDDHCAEPSGICQNVPGDSNECTDNNACTTDACVSGHCVSSDAFCFDDFPCTNDVCYPWAGCAHYPQCDDGDDCTIDTCTTSGCVFSPPISCDDGLWCTEDACSNGGCVHATADGPCDDHNPCTFDSCNAATCLHSPVPDPGPGGGTPCSAGSGNCARLGWCFGGQCNATPITCDDGDPCTWDDCSLSGSCRHGDAFPMEEIGTLSFAADRTTISWPAPAYACKPSLYRVAIGGINGFPVGSTGTFDRCLVAGFQQYGTVDQTQPAVGQLFWYIVRGEYGLFLYPASYGNQRIGGVTSPRSPTQCP